jgi:hypothetical protein
LWLVAARWRTNAASGSVSLAHGRGLRRRQILHRYRGIKDVLIVLSSPQQHTTHPHTHHPPTNTHTRRHKLEESSKAMCHNISSFFVAPTCHCHCATTVAVQSPSIPVGTVYMVPIIPVLPPRPPTVMLQACVPVHVPVVCITVFFRGRMC